MIINGPDLLKTNPLSPMLDYKVESGVGGMSFGLTECGYDIRLAQDVWMFLGRRFVLAHSIERFHMPKHLMGLVMNKSSWARRKIDASKTTNIEPGWEGHLTIELTYSGVLPIFLPAGSGICQIIFQEILNPSQYKGKYQNQPNRPVEAIY